MIFRIKLRWWSSLVATAAMLAAAWLLGATEKPLGYFASVWTALAAGAVAALGCLALNYVLHRVFGLVLGVRYAKRYHAHAMDVIRRMGPVEAVAGGLMAAVGEEPLFRGVLLPALGLSVWGVLGTAVVFGLAHFLRREYWGFFLWAIGEGVIFGTLYVTTGSIVVPAVAHGTFDTIGFLYFQRLRRLAGSTNSDPRVATKVGEGSQHPNEPHATDQTADGTIA